jgi:uncharacterized protein DUF4340
MNARTLRRLAVVLAALVVVWVGLSALRRARRDTERPLTMARFDLATVDRALIVHGADTLSFSRHGEEWTVNGFDADPSLVHDLVASLADTAPKSELVSENAATLATLGLDSLHVRRIILLQGARVVTTLLAGNEGTFGTLYVREPGQDAAYTLANGLVDLMNRSLDGWRYKTIADVPPDSVAAIEVRRGRSRYSLAKTGGTWRLGNGPADSAAVLALLNRFNILNADGFASAGQTDSVRRLAPQRTVRLLAAGGRSLLSVQIDSTRSGYYLRKDGDSTVYRMEDWDSAALTPVDSTLRPKTRPLPKARGTE